MGWLTRFTRPRIQPKWQYSAGGVIWRLLPAPDGTFVGEERDLAAKTVAVFCCDRATGSRRWVSENLPDRWWISLETVGGGVVVLQGFAQPDLPEPKKICILDSATGKVLWYNERLRFVAIHHDRLYAVEEGTTGALFFQLDVRTGEISGKAEPEEVQRILAVTRREAQREPDFPVRISGSDPVPPRVDVWRRKQTGEIDDLECIASGALTAVGCYSPVGSGTQGHEYRHIVALVGDDGNEYYRDVIKTGTRAVHADSFFRMDDTMYYIRDRQHLVAVPLTLPGDRR